MPWLSTHPQASMTNVQWASLVLTDGGWPLSTNNVNSMLQWMASENSPSTWTGTAGANNPLNNGYGSGGGAGLGSYSDLSVAAKAVVDNLNSGNYGYPAIVEALQQSSSPTVFENATVASSWSGSHYSNGSRWHSGVGDVPTVDAATSQANGAHGPVSIGNGTLVDPTTAGGSSNTFAATTLNPIPMPPAGMDSDISTGSFFINGKSMDVDVSAALVNVGIDLNITQASTLMLTLEDPERTIINNPVFAQASTLSILPDLFMWQLVAVEKQSNRVIVTFEPYVVAALRSGPTRVPFSVSPGQLTRSQFARKLIEQVQATPMLAPDSFIATLPTTNGQPPGITQEQLSRGTVDNIYEDSWTCLQRLASEVQWVCFCYDTTVYFGPQEYLAQLPVALTIQEFQNGILNIDGTYDTGQPLGTLTVNALAGSWTPMPGQSVAVSNLGPFSQNASAVYNTHPDFSPVSGQNWITATISRASVFQPDITITLQQAQPSLPEPATGGASGAVAPGVAPGAVGPQPSAQGISWWPVDQTKITQGRIDEGIDFSGSGNLIAAASGKIVSLYFPGNWVTGTWVGLLLDNPPDANHNLVYYAEYVSPSVTIGQHVNGGDIIGQATGGGIEIGWGYYGGMPSTLNEHLNGPVGTGAATPVTPEGKSFLQWITSGAV